MKGLLIKDFKLLKGQKSFFGIIMIVAIGISFAMEEFSFFIGYITFIGTLFTLSTVTYDEFDNGNAFLFSLPITRKSYILEKYGFGLIIGVISCFIATIFTMMSAIMRSSLMTMDIIMIALLVLPMSIIMLAFMLPFQFKFGGEKGRIAIIVGIGLMFIVAFALLKIADLLHIDLIAMFDYLSKMNVGMLIVVIIAIAIISLCISIKISIGIMNKKEF